MSRVRLDTGLKAARALEWLPAAAAATYLAVVVIRFSELVRDMFWDSDAASPFVLAERLRGEGTVEIPHFGWWTSLWGLLATRGIPGHAQLWEMTGYAFALTGTAILGWTVWKLAGPWAGVAAGAGALVVGPHALESLLTVNFHVSTPFLTVVIGAYLVFLLTHRTGLVLAAIIGLLAGTGAASDPLLWLAGVLPFALVVALLGAVMGRKDVVLPAAVMLGTTVAAALTTATVMERLGFHVIGTGIGPAGLADLDHNAVKLAKTIALLGGANYLYRPTYPSDPLRPLVAAVALVAVTAAVVWVLLLAWRRAPAVLAYGFYLGSAIGFTCLGYVGTTNDAAVGGATGVNYVLTLAPATAGLVALAACRSVPGRLVVSLGIATLGLTNAAELAHRPGRDNIHDVRVMHFLEQSGISRGYAGFWDAQSLTWQSRMRLTVAPVGQCDLPRTSVLCPRRFFAVDSWFEAAPGPSFLIVDPDEQGATSARPPPGRPPFRTHRIGSVTVYLFDYDIARNFRQ